MHLSQRIARAKLAAGYLIVVAVAVLISRQDSLMAQLASGPKPAAVVEGPPSFDPKDVDLFAVDMLGLDVVDAKAALARCDGDGDQQLDEEEMKQLGWYSDPMAFDLNKNKKLTQLEIAAYYAFRRQQVGIEKIDLTIMERMLRQYDRNGDRVLNAVEIREGRWPGQPRVFDLDGNGVLTAFEVAAGLARKRQERFASGVTGYDQGQAVQFVTRFDTKRVNGQRDKMIDLEEFEAAGAPFDLKQFDANGDDRLGVEEVALGYAKRRKQYDIKLIDQQNALNRLNRHDRNGDRELDEEEIVAAQWPERPDQYDLDKSKRLSRFELEYAVAKMRHAKGVSAEDIAQAAKLVVRYDKNRNGQIDLDECEGSPPVGVAQSQQINAETFISFDANFDNRLSPDETASFVASLKTD